MPATAANLPVEDETMDEDGKSEEAESVAQPVYEAPAIEETITSEEMEREVHYAGDGTLVFG